MKKILFALLASLLFTSPSWAAPLPGSDSDLPVDVTANTMEYSADKNSVMFSGDVEAVRGEFKMWADVLTLILKSKEKASAADQPKADVSNNAGDIDRIIAEKNVRFRNGLQHGSSQKATFFAKQNVLVLEGDPVIQEGKNSIRGNVIRYFINENRSVVEGSSEKRVHAVFSNEKKGK